MAESSKDNITNLGKSGREAARNAEDAVRSAGEGVQNLAEDIAAELAPERRYSFHALIAAGLIGFVVGRMCA